MAISFHTKRLLCAVMLPALLWSCGGCSMPWEDPSVPGHFTVLSYNVQNLFDDVNNGTEYDEFVPGTGEWSSDLFHLKLLRVSEVLSFFPRGGADIIVLQEVENRNALEMLRKHYLKGGGYRYWAVSTAADLAVQTAILSRFPISSVRSHAVSLDSSSIGRPLLECKVMVGTQAVVVFNCHWKSKSQGAEQSEPMRIAAASLLNTLLQENAASSPSCPVIIAGDLNECIDEWSLCGGAYQTALMPSSMSGDGAGLPIESDFSGSEFFGASLYVSGFFEEVTVHDGTSVLFSPWLRNCEYPGSYVYRGEWERIDHFLLSSHFSDQTGVEYEGFAVADDQRLLNDDGFPLRWVPEMETGYSDHLPILLYCGMVD